MPSIIGADIIPVTWVVRLLAQRNVRSCPHFGQILEESRDFLPLNYGMPLALYSFGEWCAE